MSVKVHEAFSLDSFQDRLLFFDDFHGDQLQDEWALAGAAGATAVVIDAQTGGIVRITTDGDANDDAVVYWGAIRSLLVTQKVTMEARVKLTQTTNVLVELEINKDGNEWIEFNYDSSASANWRIRTRNGGGITTGDSGIAADTDEHVFRIECFPTDEVHFYIDGVETTNSPITTNIPDDADDYLQPYLFIRTLENLAKSMDVDYVYIRQERG